MRNNWTNLLTYVFFYLYDVDFLPELLRKKEKKLEVSFNLTFPINDKFFTLNNSQIGYYIEHICPIELEYKDTTDTLVILIY